MLRTGLAKSGTTDASTKSPQANLESNAEKTQSAIAVANKNATQVSKVAAVAEAPCETEDSLDRLLLAREARFTFSQSLESLTLAFLDWGLHLANAPGRRITLAESASRQWARLLDQDLWAKPASGDHGLMMKAGRIRHSILSRKPQSWLSNGGMRRPACLPGVAKSHSAVVSFAARQVLDLYSPSNFPLTNPEVLRATAAESGRNFIRGYRNFSEDAQRVARGLPMDEVKGFAGRRRSCGDARQGGVPQ